MSQPHFVVVGHDCQMQRRVKPFFGFRQGQPLRRLQRKPALGHELICEPVLHLDKVYLQAIGQGAGARSARAHPLPESVDEFTAAERSTRQYQGYLKPVQY